METARIPSRDEIIETITTHEQGKIAMNRQKARRAAAAVLGCAALWGFNDFQSEKIDAVIVIAGVSAFIKAMYHVTYEHDMPSREAIAKQADQEVQTIEAMKSGSITVFPSAPITMYETPIE